VSFTQGAAFSGISVVKIGGSSLDGGEKIRKAAALVARKVRKGGKAIVVVSAMGRTTDQLLELARSSKCTAEDADDVLAMGERTSARVFCSALKGLGIRADYADVDDAGWPIITDGVHGNANILVSGSEGKIAKLAKARLKNKQVLVMPGFIGKTQSGRITTLGRGGSDTTAFVVGKAVGAKEIILVSDVMGVMSADPKTIKKPKKLDEIHARQLARLADSGVKFMHKKALLHKPEKIPVRLIGSMSRSLDAKGTEIRGAVNGLEISPVSDSSVGFVTVVGQEISSNTRVLEEIMGAFRKAGAHLLGISANHDSLVAYVEDRHLERVCEELHDVVLRNRETLALASRRGLALLRVSAIGLQDTPGSIASITGMLAKRGINVFGLYTVVSEIFLLVSAEEKEIAERLIAKVMKRHEKGVGQGEGDSGAMKRHEKLAEVR